MDTEELRAFVTIVRLGGFSRAAAALHRSQPAISRRVEMLEQELGASLFERTRKGTPLTDAGHALLPHAEAVLSAIQDGESAVRGLTGEPRGAVSLALPGTLASTGLAVRLRAFALENPGVRLDLRTAVPVDVSTLVRSGEVTLGLRYRPDPSPRVVSENVGEENVVVVCSSGNPLHVKNSRRGAKRRAIDPRELAGERWIAHPAQRGVGEPYPRLIAQHLAAAGLTEAEIVPVDGLTAQKRLVEAGFGLGFLTESSIRDELRLGTLATLNVPALRTSAPVCVIYRRNGYLGAAAQALLTVLRSGNWLRPNKLGKLSRGLEAHTR
jgi:DNA-binding transcriptional LysR family regulator